MTPGYFGDDKATAESFVTIGGLKFFRTGDIGEIMNGQIKVAQTLLSAYSDAILTNSCALDH